MSMQDKYDPTSPMGQVAALLAPPQGPPDDSLGSKALWGLDAVLGLPRRALLSVPGQVINAMGLSENTGAEAVTDMIQQGINSTPQAVDPASNALKVLNLLFGEDVQRVGVEALTDPLNLIGGPGKFIGKNVGETLLAKQAARGIQLPGGGAIPGSLTTGEKALGIAAQGLYTADDMASAAMGAVANRIVKGAQTGLSPINTALGRAMPTLEKWSLLGEKTAAAGDVAQMLEQRGFDFNTAIATFSNRPADLIDVLPMGMRGTFNANDFIALLGANPNANTWDEALIAYSKNTQKALGIGSHNQAAKFYSELTNWWKRQALASVAYPITNILGGMVGFAAEGSNPLLIAQDVVKNADNIWNARDFHIDDAAKLSSQTGMPIPSSLRQEAQNATASQIGTQAGQNAGRDAVILGALGALGAGPAGALFGAAIGGATGYGVAKLASKVQQVSYGIETVLRERGWTHGMGRELLEAADEMEGVVRAALSQPRNPRAGRTTGGTIPNSIFADNIAAFIQSNGGRVSADDIAAHLKATSPVGKKGGGGIQSTVLNAAEDAIDDILWEASQRGKQTSEAFNFNYNDLSNIERVMHNIAPFSTWLMKALPYYFTKGAEHPWAVNLVTNWNSQSEQTRRESGLTGRYSGALPWQSGSVLASAILGRPTDVWVNPIASLIPAGDMGQAMNRLDYAESPSQKLLAAGDIVGVSPNPIIGAGLRIAGLGDQDSPAEGLPIRAAGVVSGLTGVDLTAATRNLEEGVRESIPGRPQVTDIGQIMTERRIDELALRNTGKPIGSPGTEEYLRAKLAKSGDIWEAAKQEVSAERGLQAGAGFVNSQFRPQALTSVEEKRIRAAGTDRILDRTFTTTLDNLKGDPLSTVPKTLQDKMTAALQRISAETGEPIHPNAQAVLDAPTVENYRQLAQDIFNWERTRNPEIAGYSGSGSQEKRDLQYALSVYMNAALLPADRLRAAREYGPNSNPVASINKAQGSAREKILDQYPIVRKYLDWKKQNPNGTIDEFIENPR